VRQKKLSLGIGAKKETEKENLGSVVPM